MKSCVFNRGKKCAVLTSHNCEKCSFRKTERELQEDRASARKRIESLPDDQYNAIMKKYYGVRTPSEVERW